MFPRTAASCLTAVLTGLIGFIFLILAIHFSLDWEDRMSSVRKMLGGWELNARWGGEKDPGRKSRPRGGLQKLKFI